MLQECLYATAAAKIIKIDFLVHFLHLKINSINRARTNLLPPTIISNMEKLKSFSKSINSFLKLKRKKSSGIFSREIWI